MSERRPRRQHFVPRFYLEHFTDEEGLVWTYDAQDDTVRSAPPRRTAFETNFYSVLDKDGNFIDAIEHWLADVENNAAPHYPKLLRGEVLEGQSKADFAVFLSSLYTRSPAMIRMGAELKGILIQKMSDVVFADRKRFEQAMNELDAEQGKKTSREERDKAFEFANDKTKYVLNVDRKAGLQVITATDQITEVLYAMSWIVYNCERQHLITSDTPVYRSSPPESHHPIFGDGGFVNRRVRVTVPLSPSKLLMMGWFDQPRARIYDADKQDGRLANRQRAHLAERYLYASKNESGIRALARRHKEPGLRFRSSAQGRIAPIKIKRSLTPR